MRAFLLAAVLAVAGPAVAQPVEAAPDPQPFRHDVMLAVSGAYFGGVGLDTEFRAAPHLGARVGLGLLNVDPFAGSADPAVRATALGIAGDPKMELQGGVGVTVASATVGFGQRRVRQTSVVPHVYAGVRSVLAFGDTPDGRRAPAPHLAVRAGAMLTVDEPGESGARFRPELGLGFAF